MGRLAAMATTYSPALRAFLEQSPLNRPSIAAFLSAAATATPAGSRVLDAGAGDAPYRELFSHCDYITSDWAGSMHAGARSADIIAPIEALPVDDDAFETVVCTEVLEHVARPAVAAGELFRVLAPGGRIWVTVPFVWELHEEPHDYFRYTSHGLRQVLEDAGFVDVTVRPLTGYFATLGQVTRAYGSITGVGRNSGLRRRATAAAMARIGLLLGRLDGDAARRGLPLGFSATGLKPSRAPS